MPKYANHEIFSMLELGIIAKPEARALLEIDESLNNVNSELKQAMAEAEIAVFKPDCAESIRTIFDDKKYFDRWMDCCREAWEMSNIGDKITAKTVKE